MNPDQMYVMITGASGGIGSQVARLLSQQGARILAVGRNQQALADLLKSLKPHSSMAHRSFNADLCDPVQRQRLLADLTQEQLHPNVLINLAGTNQLTLFQDQSESQIRRLIDTNLTSTMLLTQGLLPILLQQKQAQILNVGSTFGSIGYPGYVSYCTTKFALRGFTEALQRELSDTAVQVQYFAPRATRTGLNSAAAEQLNSQLKNAMDSPEAVAHALITLLNSQNQSLFLGWPEKLFVKINALFPAVVGRAIGKQLKLIKLHSSATHTL